MKTQEYKGRVYIESGHHFGDPDKGRKPDPGAIGVGGIKESVWAHKAKALLSDALVRQSNGQIEIILDDDSMTLAEVIGTFRKTITSNDLLISIHFNSASVNTATGVEGFVDDNASQRSIEFGEEAVDLVSKVLGLKNRGLKKSKQSNRGTLGILKLKGIALLIELGFINNFKDVQAAQDWLHWALWDLAGLILQKLEK